MLSKRLQKAPRKFNSRRLGHWIERHKETRCAGAEMLPGTPGTSLPLEQQPVRIERRLTKNVVPSFNQPDIFLIVFGLEPRRRLG